MYSETKGQLPSAHGCVPFDYNDGDERNVPDDRRAVRLVEDRTRYEGRRDGWSGRRRDRNRTR